MKKIFALAALSGLAILGANNVAAQTTQSAVVGNPGSTNMLIVEEGYEVVAPATDSVNSASPQSADWSQEGNVEVAPLSGSQQPAAASGNNNNADSGNAGAAPAANAADSGTVNVDENITEMTTPNTTAVEVDETLSN